MIDLEHWAAEVIAFYTASLPNIIEPDLEFFASYYMDPSCMCWLNGDEQKY